MKITIKLFSILRRYLPPNAVDSSFEIEIASGSKVIDILVKTNIPLDLPRIILINGKRAFSLEEPVKDNDTISFFPPMAGG